MQVNNIKVFANDTEQPILFTSNFTEDGKIEISSPGYKTAVFKYNENKQHEFWLSPEPKETFVITSKPTKQPVENDKTMNILLLVSIAIFLFVGYKLLSKKQETQSETIVNDFGEI